MFFESGKANLNDLNYVMTVDNVQPVKFFKRTEGEYDRLFFSYGNGPVQRFADREWKIKNGDLVYIPHNCAYIDFYSSDNENDTILAILKADLGSEPFHISFGDNAAMRGMWTRLLDEFEHKRSGWYCNCMQLLYAILGTVFKKAQSEYIGSAAAIKLAPAMEYFAAHFRDPEANVPLAASKCSVSYSRFRKLFHNVYGMSAKAYLIHLRVENACRLLSESALPVTDIATMSGFRDEYYFSTAFKKITGKSPTAFRSRQLAIGDKSF